MPFPTVENLRAGMARGMQFDFQPTPGIIARDINKFGMDIRSFREPLMRAIREVMIPSFMQNFAQGGRPPWQPLSEVTVQMRGSATPILVRGGRLRRTMSQVSIWTVTSEHAVIHRLPAHSWYGALHQAGNRTNVVIPARPFALIQPEDQEKIERVFERWLAERAVRAGWTIG